MGASMPGSFTPGEAPSLKGGIEDSWPNKDMKGKHIDFKKNPLFF